MNIKYFGDSFDLVKRTLLASVKSAGFKIACKPMFTAESTIIKSAYFQLLNIDYDYEEAIPTKNICLFLDPDTGISTKPSPKHVSFDEILVELNKGYGLLIVFDQSFSRNANQMESILTKINYLKSKDISSFYYNSHASFLFASFDNLVLSSAENLLLELGIPSSRIIK